MKRALPVALALPLLLLVAGPAFGEDDPRRVKADQIFAEGMKLHEKDREKEALEKFKEAYAIYPSPNALFAMARVEAVLSMDLDALNHFREAMKSPLLHPKNQEMGKGYVSEIEGRIGRLEIRAPEGTTFEIDGAVLAEKAPLPRMVDVLPGEHAVKMSSAGTVVARTARVGKGEIAHLSFANDAPQVATPGPAHEASVSSDGAKRSWVIPAIVGGVGVVALGVGVGFGVASIGTRDDAVALGSPGACTDQSSASCAAYRDKWDLASSQKTIAMVSGIGGGVLIGAAAAILFWPTKSTANARIVPAIGNVAGASIVGNF